MSDDTLDHPPVTPAGDTGFLSKNRKKDKATKKKKWFHPETCEKGVVYQTGTEVPVMRLDE